MGKARTLLEHYRRFGARSAAHLVVAQPLENAGLVRIGYCMGLQLSGLPDPPAGRTPAEVRRLTEPEISAMASRAEDWFFPGAVQVSLERGDPCFAIVIDGEVACSHWCTTEPLQQFGLLLHPPPDGFLEYRLFTKPRFRGLGLQADLRRHVWRHYAARGFTWHLNTMYWTNAVSIAVQRKLGFRRVGTIVQVGAESRGWSRMFGGREAGLRATPLPRGARADAGAR